MRFKSQYARDLFVLILMQPTHHYADSGGGSASASAWYNPKGSGSCIGESGFTNLVRLSKSLMDQCALHEDFTNARGMLQVAMQYYRLTEEINSGVSLNFGMKEYLQTSLRSRPICHSLDMWQHAFSRDVDAAIIADPAASCDDNNPNNVSDETFFSLIGSLVYDMLTVEVPVGKVHTFVSVMCSTYQKGKEMFDTMKQLVDNVYRALELSKDQPPAKNRSNRVTNSIDGLGNGGPLALKRQTSVMPTAGSTGGNDTTSKSRHYDLDNVIRRKMSVGERNQSPSSKNSSASTVDKEEHLSSPTTTTGILGFNLRTRKKAQSSISSQCVMLCNQNAPILSMITLQNRVVCGISDSTIAVFDTNHPEKKSKLEGHTGPVVAVQLRGNTLISGSRDHTLRVWDMRIATRKRTIMSYVGFSSSNPMVTSNDDIMEIDPAMISKKSLIMKGHTAPVTCVEIGRQLTTERALVASGSEDATIRLWDTTRESSISLLGNGKGSISCLRFIPLGDLLVSGCRKNTLKIWDLASSKMRSNITIHKGALRDIQITGDRLVTASNDRTVKVWDVNFRSGQSYTHSLRDHGGPVLCTSLGGPADPNICTGSTDGIVRVWDLRYVRKGPRLTLKGHLGSVSCIQRDFTKLVSAGEDGNLKVWDMHSGLCLKDIKGHLSGVTCISFRDASIFSASWDGSVRVWDIDGGPIVETTAASIVVSSKNPNVSSSSTTTSAFRNWINPFH
jgi:WD40 repeat protein